MPNKNKFFNLDESFFSLSGEKRDNLRNALVPSNLTPLGHRNESRWMNEKQSLPSNKEWVSSEYSYNKVKQKLSLPTKKTVDQLIKNYFDLNILKDGKKSRRIEIRFKRLSPNKIFVSKSEIKHTNNKVIITIYTYNRERRVIDYKISKLSNKTDTSSVNRVKSLRQKYENNFIGKTRLAALKSIRVLRRIRNTQKLLLKSLNWDKESFKSYETKYYKTFLKKLYKKQIISLIYEKSLFFTSSKFNNWFLLGIKSLLSNIYKKKVELNIVDLKYLHFNSDNFVEAVSTKLKNRNNRLLRVLKNAIRLVKLPSIGLPAKSSSVSNLPHVLEQNNNNLNIIYPLSSIGVNKEVNNMRYKKVVNKEVLDSILKTTKYKIVNGVRLEAAGRLSKRLTASRSVFKYKYKGSLKDIASSYEKLSSTLSRGYSKPNVERTYLSSKTRNGAFGLKGSVSAYTGPK